MKFNILNRALAGERFIDLHIVDSHCHMGPWYNYYFPKAEIEDMMHDADIIGVEKMCIAPHASISCDYKLGNSQVYDAICKYPKRVYGLLTLNPNFPEEFENEFNRYYKMEQFIGVKIHPSLCKYPVDGSNLFLAYEKIRKLGGYVLTHSWEEGPFCSTDSCENVIRAFPEVPFVLAHAAGTNVGVSKAINLANKYENAYLDTSGFEFSDTWIEEVISKIDETKVFFGSDCPFHDLRGGISRILFSNLEDHTKEKVLSGNFNRMLLKYPKKIVTDSGATKI